MLEIRRTINSFFSKKKQQTEELFRYIVVFITCPNKKVSEKIAEILLEKKLAACINILDNVTSYYWWKSEKESSQEVLMIVKTRRELLKKLTTNVIEAHPYDLPEIIAVPLVGGSISYLKWIDKETRKN
jgi:periplasmic divalent cation tolerance protein